MQVPTSVWEMPSSFEVAFDASAGDWSPLAMRDDLEIESRTRLLYIASGKFYVLVQDGSVS